MKKLFLLLLLLTTPAFAKDKGITVYIGYAETDGLVSNGIKDSAKDVADAVSKKGFSIVSNKADADIILTVTGRKSSFEKEGSQSMGYGISKDTYAETRVVLVRLESGSFSEVIDGAITSQLASWRSCAGVVAKYLDNWVKSNRDELLKRRPPQ